MDLFRTRLSISCVFLIMLACNRAVCGSPPGLLEGHLKIVSPKEVELAGASSSKCTAGNYSEYPLLILSKAEQKEVARVTADGNEHHRSAATSGDNNVD